jgi:hypothetical protein
MSIILTGILIIFICMACGCETLATPAPASEFVTVEIIATRDYGKELIFERTAEIKGGLSAQDALNTVAETGMAGSYIEGIEGIYGDQEFYWFYYMNGILSNVFASGYRPHDGDVEQWDFHDYSYFMHGSSAIIGNFPEPFLHGFAGEIRPTMIVYDTPYEKQADMMKKALEKSGVTEVSSETSDVFSPDEKGNYNLVLICSPDYPVISELNEVHDRIGLFVHFENGSLIVINEKGDIEGEYNSGCGVIQACQNPWTPGGSWACESVVWMISGTDETGIQNAVDALTERFPELHYANAVVVSGEEIIKVP